MKVRETFPANFERRWLQLLALAISLPTLWLIGRGCPCFHRGELLGISNWR